MEVHLEPGLKARLARLAAERGSNVESLAREAIERLVDYDDWSVREVEKGLASAEGGELPATRWSVARIETDFR